MASRQHRPCAFVEDKSRTIEGRWSRRRASPERPFHILEHETYAYGYDAQTGEYGNLISKGIIDPTKVVRAALQGAASVAGLLITTEAMVAEVPKKEAATPAMPHGGGMDF